MRTSADLDALAANLDAVLPGKVARRVPVATLSTYRLGGPIDVLVEADGLDALRAVAAAVADAPPPILVVGRGSNLLVADAGFGGVGIVLGAGFQGIEIDAPAGRVHAGGAVALPQLARRVAAAGLTGLEFLVGIPGSVGGAVRMNGGGHGSDVRSVLVEATVCDLLAGAEPVSRSGEDLELGYRRSNVTSADVVTAATFAAAGDRVEDCEARIDEVVRWRREHQPGGANAGSVFRNPPGDSAGRLIDAVGCKGMRVGGAVVSPKHANFFQAEPGATADDVRDLVRAVQARVLEETDVRLVPELHMVGFDDGDEETR